MVAWLITEVPNPTDVVMTVLNYRLSGSTVGSIMERLYVERRLGLFALLEYAKTGKTPAPWKHGTLDGLPWSEEVWCGSGDRFYWGRKVDSLKITSDGQGPERLIWAERKRPDLSHIREAIGLPPLEEVSRAPHTDA
jgi:hypothetical protein